MFWYITVHMRGAIVAPATWMRLLQSRPAV
jgi:hypothetical protein